MARAAGLMDTGRPWTSVPCRCRAGDPSPTCMKCDGTGWEILPAYPAGDDGGLRPCFRHGTVHPGAYFLARGLPCPECYVETLELNWRVLIMETLDPDRSEELSRVALQLGTGVFTPLHVDGAAIRRRVDELINAGLEKPPMGYRVTDLTLPHPESNGADIPFAVYPIYWEGWGCEEGCSGYEWSWREVRP